MNNIKNLFLLERKLGKNGNKAKRIVSNIFVGLFAVVCSMVVTSVICSSLQLVGDSLNFVGNLSFFILAIQIILLVYCLTNLQKSLLLNRDKPILSYLPITKWQIFMAKAIKCFIDLYIVSTIISLPVLFSFGYSFGLTGEFYALSLVAVLIMPLLPFGIANLLLIPFMALQNFLKNKGILKLVISIVLTVVLFYLYIEIVFNVADTLLLKNTASENILETLTDYTTNKFLPSTWISRFVVSKNIISFSIILGSSILSVVGGMLLGCLTYKNIFNKTLVEKNVAKVMPTKSKKRSAFKSYFVTEIKDIFRNSNYAYTYFGMAVAMPLLVYSCGKFMLEFAVERIGENIVFGTTLLVILIFMSIICSPTSAFISKEGDNFWILKTNPKGIKFPLFAKSLVGVMSSVISLVLTLLLLLITGLIKPLSALLIFGLALVYIVGLVALGLVLNLYKPNIFHSNKENNSNMITHMLFGFVLSIGVGVLAIINSFKYSIPMVALICAIIIVVFAFISVLVLFTQHKKLYARMEV